MPQINEKAEQSRLLQGRRPLIQIAERPMLQPPKLDTQPKIISKAPII